MAKKNPKHKRLPDHQLPSRTPRINPKKFWDSKQMREAAYQWAKSHELDWDNQLVKEELREIYRKKWGITAGPNGECLAPEYHPKSKNTQSSPKRKQLKQVLEAAIEEPLKKDSPTEQLLQDVARANTQGIKNISLPVLEDPNADGDDPESDYKPAITHRKWKGEQWDGEKWVLPKKPRIDYFAWYNTFIQPYFGPDADPLGKCHEEWCDELESDDFVELLKPRDHFKTSLISIGYTVYNLVEEILYPVLIVSKADLNTRDTFAAIRDHLENNTLVLSFYGYIINKERSLTGELLFTQYQPTGTKDPALYCSTFGEKKVMGTHPRMAILDDIEERLLSAAYMYQAKVLLDKSLIGGLPKGSKLILLGTIKGWDHTNDIYLYAKAKGVFSYFESPASYKIDRVTKQPILNEDGSLIYGLPEMNQIIWEKRLLPVLDKNGKEMLTYNGKPKRKMQFLVEFIDNCDQDWMPIFPERYTIKDLVLKRLLMREVDNESDDTFWSEFYLRPMKPGGNFFKKNRVGPWPPAGFANTEAFLAYIRQFKDDWKPVCWIDPGGKKSHGISMAIMIFNYGKRYVIDLKVIRTGIPGAAEQIYKWIQRYGVKIIACESNFAQKETFVDAINRELWHYMTMKDLNGNPRKVYNIIVQGVPNREDKILRIQSNMTEMLGLENTDQTFFVNPGADDYEQWCQEFGMFPKLLPGVNFEWDLLDCVSSCYIHLSDIGAYGSECDAVLSYS